MPLNTSPRLSPAAKSSIRCKGSLAASPSFLSNRISLRPPVRACLMPPSEFIAIHGQNAQLLQLPPLPAVGAAINSLSSMLLHFVQDAQIGCHDEFFSGRDTAALSSLLVEPTTSPSSMTLCGDSG